MQLLEMRLLATQIVIRLKFTPADIDRNPHPVDKDEYPVRELVLGACNGFHIVGPTHKYQHSSA